jgi:hypothetical protein
MARSAIVDLLCRGFGPADLTRASGFGMTWAKVGQVFATHSLAHASVYTDFHTVGSVDTAMALIDGCYFNRAQRAGRVRVEKGLGGAFEVVFLDPVPLSAVSLVWLPEAWRAEIEQLSQANDEAAESTY